MIRASRQLFIENECGHLAADFSEGVTIEKEEWSATMTIFTGKGIWRLAFSGTFPVASGGGLW